MSRYYRTCPECGAHLDPGEICDCRKEGRPAVPAPDDHNKESEDDIP